MFLHYTHPDNVPSIQQRGLETGRIQQSETRIEWVLNFYDENPVYLTLEYSEFISEFRKDIWSHYACFEVDIGGLPLVSDLPSLVDKGARYDQGLLYMGGHASLEPMLPFCDEAGWIEIEQLIDHSTDAAVAAIKITGTAACIAKIPPRRLALRGPSQIPQVRF